MSTKYSSVLVLPAAFLLVAAIGCSGSPKQLSQEQEQEDSTTAETQAPADPSSPGEEPSAADELAAKEQDVARREAEVALQEREQAVARREAALSPKPAAPKPSSPAKSTAPTSSTTTASATPPPPPQKPAPRVVPAGTQLSVEIVSPLTTKTAKVGDRVDARLASDLVVDGSRIAPAGAAVQGSVTEVVSGSKKIGGTPTLGLTFDGLELGTGSMVGISGTLVQQGKSDTAKDSAKIAGAVVAGAIIGHQVNEKKGKLIGAVLGGAAGTAAAAKTGGEVEVPAGTLVGFTLDAPVEVE